MQVGANADVKAAFVGYVGFDAVFLEVRQVFVNSFAKAFLERSDASALVGNEISNAQQTTVKKLILGTV